MTRPPTTNAPFRPPGALRMNDEPANPFLYLSAFKPFFALSAFLKLNSATLKPLKILPISLIVLPILRGFNHLSPIIKVPNANIPLAKKIILCQVLIPSPRIAFARLLIPATNVLFINALIPLNTAHNAIKVSLILSLFLGSANHFNIGIPTNILNRAPSNCIKPFRKLGALKASIMRVAKFAFIFLGVV